MSREILKSIENSVIIVGLMAGSLALAGVGVETVLPPAVLPEELNLENLAGPDGSQKLKLPQEDNFKRSRKF